MYFNAIVVNTEMGDIQFAGFDKLKEVNDMIIGRFHLKKDNNTVRYSANVYNDDSSSFLKDLSRNHTPNTEIRKVYRMSN
jgi:predicted nucleotidyltransferase